MVKLSLLIAVVDDEESILKAIDRLLQSSGHQVRTFSSGALFLQSLNEFQPDCVMLDLNLPGLKGDEILHSLAQFRPHLPVIIITAYDKPGLQEQLLSSGASFYLAKPFNGKTLLDAIDLCVNSDSV